MPIGSGVLLLSFAFPDWTQQFALPSHRLRAEDPDLHEKLRERQSNLRCVALQEGGINGIQSSCFAWNGFEA